MVPSLRHAEVVADWAGLRPARERVLISLEHHQVPVSAVRLLLLYACGQSNSFCRGAAHCFFFQTLYHQEDMRQITEFLLTECTE